MRERGTGGNIGTKKEEGKRFIFRSEVTRTCKSSWPKVAHVSMKFARNLAPWQFPKQVEQTGSSSAWQSRARVSLVSCGQVAPRTATHHSPLALWHQGTIFIHHHIHLHPWLPTVSKSLLPLVEIKYDVTTYNNHR